jgi:transposase-like protein
MSTSRRKHQARQRATRERAARQTRRERAAELFAQGRSQAEVARELDVSPQSASRWHTRWQAEGTAALRTRGPTGRRPKVADEQLEAIEQRSWVAHEWPRIKRGSRRIGLDRLVRRIRHLADPPGASHLVGAWAHAGPAPPYGLEAGLHGRRPRLPLRPR